MCFSKILVEVSGHKERQGWDRTGQLTNKFYKPSSPVWIGKLLTESP